MTGNLAFAASGPITIRSNFNGNTSGLGHPNGNASDLRRPIGHTVARRNVRNVTVCMNANSEINFDAIAAKLADELKDVTGRVPIAELDGGEGNSDAVGGHFDVEFGNGNIPMIRLRHEQSAQTAEVYTYGACVTSWNVRGNEVLWMSDTNKWEDGGKAIRGGIPLCFPQFGPYGDLVSHGFARISSWTIKDTVVNEDGSVSAIFSLDNQTGKHEQIEKWGFDFSAEYTVTLSNVGLEAKLAVTNTGGVPIPISFAFHNYFKVSCIEDVRLFGFEELRHLNRLDGDRELPPAQDIEAGVTISEETDRIYLDAPDELAIFDFKTLRVVKIKKTPTLSNATMWNPYGSEGCDPGWKEFVCIEPAVVNPAVTIQPGETWVGAQLLGLE